MIVKLQFNLKVQGEGGEQSGHAKAKVLAESISSSPPLVDGLILKDLAFQPELISVMDWEWL